ncbi:MAG: hypothetical protein DRJ69_05370, partial [Thermoprotei archaeon]
MEKSVQEVEEAWGTAQRLMEVDALDPSEAEYVKAFFRDLKLILKELATLELEASKRVNPSAEDDPELSERFKDLHRRLIDTASRPGMLGPRAMRLVNKAWGAGLKAFTSFLERHAHLVGVEGWSLGAALG